MADTMHPTPYANVNAVLRDFLAHIQAILGDQLRGMYLIGSLALGDFDPRSSDIDFVVVTIGKLTEAAFLALREMHVRFAASGSPWATKIEAVYIPQGSLRHSGTARYPQIEKGGTLALERLEDAWSAQCYTLRECGVVIAGSDPYTLLDPVDPDTMRREGVAIMEQWLRQARHDPSWLEWLRERRHQAFVVQTLCRLLYTYETGGVASKPAAARWARQRVDERRAALITRSVAAQHEGGVAPESDVHETVAFIAYTIERCRQPAGYSTVH
jgi:hypothetical protein